MKNRTSTLAAAILAATIIGCSKQSPPAHPPTVPPAKLIAASLGVVEVSDGVPSRHDIGDGRVCIIKPTIQKDGSVMMVISVAETNSPSERVVSSLRVETLSDEAVSMANGVISVSLTPHIKK